MKLERAQIVEAALDLLNDSGVDGLSTHQLAKRLGVQQPALYWHFKNKAALLDAMNLEILNRGHTHHFPKPREDWQSFLLENGRSFRRALLAYRDGARVHAGSEGVPGQLDRFEKQLEFLTANGFTIKLAMQTMIAIGRYVVGCALEEQAEQHEAPGRGAHLDQEARSYPLFSKGVKAYRSAGMTGVFDAGLKLIIEGASASLKKQG